MMQSPQLLHKLAPYARGATFFAIFTGVAKAFDLFDPRISKSQKESLARWLRNLPPDPEIESWAAVFPQLIDKIFGERPFSWNFFIRSSVASTTAVFLCGIAFVEIEGVSGLWDTALTIILFLVGGVLANFLPDYVSLLISRQIVRWMSREPTTKKTIFLLLLDILSTTLLASVTVYISMLVIIRVLGHEPTFYGAIVQARREFLTYPWLPFVKPDPYDYLGGLYGVFFYSALFPALWVWLYASSGFVIKGLRTLRFGWGWLTPRIELDEHPLSTMGIVAGLIAGVVYLTFVSGHYLCRHL